MQARRYFIACEEALKHIAPEVQQQLAQLWQASRDEARKPFRPLNDALKRSIERQGRAVDRGVYIREIQMLNTIMLGIDPESWKQENGIRGNLREHLNAEQLERLSYLERADEFLLDGGITDFYERKRKLEKMHREWFGYIANSEEKRRATVQANIQKLKAMITQGGNQ